MFYHSVCVQKQRGSRQNTIFIVVFGHSDPFVHGFSHTYRTKLKDITKIITFIYSLKC